MAVTDTIHHPSTEHHTRFAVRAERVFDGTTMHHGAALVVQDGTIAAVARSLPGGLPTVDLGPRTVLPGLVDCHQHLVFDGDGTLEQQVANATDAELTERARRAARRALEGGVTTLRDLGDRAFVTLGLRDDPDLPTIAAAGPPITSVQGHCWYLGGECPDRTSMLRAVADRAERGTNVVKIMVTGGMLTPTFPAWKSQFSVDDLRATVDAAHAAGLPVAAHCHGLEGIAEAIDVGVDTIEHCTFMNEAMQSAPNQALLMRLAESGIPVSATFGRLPGSQLPPGWEPRVLALPLAMRSFLDQGGRVVLGSDAGISPHKPHDVAPWAIRSFLDLDEDPLHALRAMTRDGADALGLPRKGRLARGADADILVVDGDPTTNPDSLADVVAVWKAGHPVDRSRPQTWRVGSGTSGGWHSGGDG